MELTGYETCYNCGNELGEFIFRDWEDESEGVALCRECIDNKYPREKEVVEKVVTKTIIQPQPNNKYKTIL